MNMPGKPDTPLLDVSDLAVQFRVPSRGGVFYQGSSDVKAVDGVSFSMLVEKHLGLSVKVVVGSRQLDVPFSSYCNQLVVVWFLMMSQYMNFGRKKVRSGYGITDFLTSGVACK